MAEQTRPRILLCWGYHREEWIACFEDLREEFEFIYLFYRQSWEEGPVRTQCQRVYWNDFSSGLEIIEKLRPTKVLNMTVDSGYSVALNLACRARGIPTCILQHGLTYPLADYLNAKQTRDTTSQITPPSGKSISKFETLKFLFRSLSWWQYPMVPYLLCYFVVQAKIGNWHAQHRLGSRATRPDHYICFAYKNAQLYRDLDPEAEARTTYIGVPEYSPYFQRRPREPQGTYFLLIDQPWAENQYFDIGISREQMRSMYLSLAEFAGSHNRRLAVKLHPESYDSDWLPEDPNIDWLRKVDIFEWVTGADGIFGSNSTLMFLALYYRPCYLIDGEKSDFVRDVLGRGLAQGCALEEFRVEDIEFCDRRSTPEHERFVQDYLGPIDGQTKSRLKSALLM